MQLDQKEINRIRELFPVGSLIVEYSDIPNEKLPIAIALILKHEGARMFISEIYLDDDRFRSPKVRRAWLMCDYIENWFKLVSKPKGAK